MSIVTQNVPHLVPDVEVAAPGGGPGGAQVGEHDGGQHGAPA